ncbi:MULTISPECIES: flagellar basal body L-ring protein FlgH [Kordiimonas]|jgi:flagellar L-ring protein precursor FlgH|uniref:Flagellar L-ring protein n=1 Tax=Kordiimonas lacus TaxID=637679 RepID=A0A1G6VZ38_9PROT|nr:MULTISPECIES: flagellar basal body L-ring protein FlgH [Kordiimonas]SDD58892.1 flagellar L-ring protein precursor FlgH [Kordiimonas lacus]
MIKNAIRKIALTAALASLAACGAADRISNIGKAPDMTPIKDIKAPVAQRSISLPMPNNTPDKYQPNSLWRTGARAFFKDQRAGNIGDILTVNIDISDSAQIGNSTSRSRSTAEDAGLSNFLGLEQAIPNLLYGNADNDREGGSHEAGRSNFSAGSMVNADSTTSYEGNGSVNRSEAISLTVAAIVTEVLPNGNLVIQGRQEVRVNFEKRELLLAGIVRPEDISSSNTISHTQIAEARISYGGKGQLTDVQQPRYGTQLYDIIFPF